MDRQEQRQTQAASTAGGSCPLDCLKLLVSGCYVSCFVLAAKLRGTACAESDQKGGWQEVANAFRSVAFRPIATLKPYFDESHHAGMQSLQAA